MQRRLATRAKDLDYLSSAACCKVCRCLFGKKNPNPDLFTVKVDKGW